MTNSIIKNPLIIALDVDSQDQALRLAEALTETAGCFKIGPRLLNKYGENLIKKISLWAPVFVDCKFFDIPNTMESAVRSCFEAGASLVTVHALAGQEALQRVAKLQNSKHKILAVTILTSWDQNSFPPIIKNESIQNHVVSLADLAKSSGIDGIVCSAEELQYLKAKDLFLVTPGIRLDSDKKDDQKRTMGPTQAMQNGASALVVGRPIIEAIHPQKTAAEFLKLIQQTGQL